MSRKWLKKEAPVWVQNELITQQQADRLLAFYKEEKPAVGILPLLGSLLVGLGILSFVAANWQDIPHLARFAVIVLAMLGFYAAGERFIRRGDDRLGLGLVAIGLISFGAGIFLLAQMFQMTAANAGSFIIWGSAGVMLTYLYRSRFLFLLSAVILNVGQFYSLNNFGTFSIVAFLVLMVGLGIYWWRNRSAWLAWLLGLSAMLQSAFLIGELELNGSLYMIPVMILYVLGDWIRTRNTASPLQNSALTAAFVTCCIAVMAQDNGHFFGFAAHERTPSLVFAIVVAALLALSAIAKKRQGRLTSGFEWLLLLPYFYAAEAASFLYLLALCFFSLCVLWRGYAEEERFKVNLGTMLFLFSVLLAYVKLAWGFMDKSVFFLVGGILLLGLSWYLNKRRRRFLAEEGEDRHD
ncbi:DUF2157 domain-containing protein [Paenibacillus sp. MBLB4367]|uniref:DUF2157 domain-containing protein n=1 Tax=Paenibacillus sp. MBLB4367 TaxID=3384767 RepID=UPI00390821A3